MDIGSESVSLPQQPTALGESVMPSLPQQIIGNVAEKAKSKNYIRRTEHQHKATVRYIDSDEKITVSRQEDGMFHCGRCEYRNVDPTSLQVSSFPIFMLIFRVYKVLETHPKLYRVITVIRLGLACRFGSR
jgi:hypothetical protein